MCFSYHVYLMTRMIYNIPYPVGRFFQLIFATQGGRRKRRAMRVLPMIATFFLSSVPPWCLRKLARESVPEGVFSSVLYGTTTAVLFIRYCLSCVTMYLIFRDQLSRENNDGNNNNNNNNKNNNNHDNSNNKPTPYHLSDEHHHHIRSLTPHASCSNCLLYTSPSPRD